MTCARYAACAYEDYFYDSSNDLFYESKNSCPVKDIRSVLGSENYNDINCVNYGNINENDASYTIGHKKVNFNDGIRDLTVIVIRGTDGKEWYGNMSLGGDAQDTSLLEHYSFRAAADALETDVENYMQDPNGDGKTTDAISNSLVLITGHSRGGAVGNLLASDLTKGNISSVDTNGVYAYLFASPGCTRQADTSLKNIYTFCFSDDFVPQFPPGTWGYGRNGQTMWLSAQKLYSLGSATTFKRDTKKSTYNSRGSASPDFNLKKTTDVYTYVGNVWPSVTDYYLPKSDINLRLYTYLHEYLAAIQAEDADKLTMLGLVLTLVDNVYKPITSYLLKGNILSSYLNDTHQMYTYYAALKTGHFNYPNGAAGSVQLYSQMSVSVPALPDAAETAALKAFANTGGNLALLGWDLDDLTTWEGVAWSLGTGHVTSVDFYYSALTGALDLSSFTELDKLDIYGNELASLTLPTGGTLSELYCGNNQLTALDLSGQTGLTALDCTGNYLNVEAMEADLTALEAGGVLLNYAPQKIPGDAAYHQADLAALQTILGGSASWDLTTSPDTWAGVTWEKQGVSYRVTALDIAGSGFSGALDVSSLTALTVLNCSSNQLSVLDASGCIRLTWLNCSDNLLTSVILSPGAPLATFVCNNNYLGSAALGSITAAVESLPDGLSIVGHQNILASVSDFSADEYSTLSALAASMGWDTEAPGDWPEVTWTLDNGTYYAESLNLDACTTLTGSLNLSGFSHLTSLSLADTGFTDVILPPSMTDIKDSAFYNCDSLTAVVLPANISAIGRMAFSSCDSLNSVTLPDGLLSIGDNAFFGCRTLTGIRIPATVTTIGEKAFAGCIEMSYAVFLGGAVTVIGNGAFSETPPSLKIGWFAKESGQSNAALESLSATAFGNSAVGGWCGSTGGTLTLLAVSSSTGDISATVYAAVYDNGKMKDITSRALVLTNGAGTVTIQEFSEYTGLEYKVYILDSLTYYTPLSKPLAGDI
jgi:hypothetical protein